MTLIALEPVDRVVVTTLVDNTADMLLPDVGPVRRWGLSGTGGPLPVAPSGVAVGRSTLDFLRAEHGYSALVDVYQGGRRGDPARRRALRTGAADSRAGSLLRRRTRRLPVA